MSHQSITGMVLCLLVWYGLFIIDNSNIDNQYHRSIGHLPLNENIEGTPTAYTSIYRHDKE